MTTETALWLALWAVFVWGSYWRIQYHLAVENIADILCEIADEEGREL